MMPTMDILYLSRLPGPLQVRCMLPRRCPHSCVLDGGLIVVLFATPSILLF